MLDVLGYVPFAKAGAEVRFDVVGWVYERKSLIVSTNLPFKAWVTRLAAAVGGEAEPSPTFEDGLRCQEVMDALRLSHREGRWVPLPLDGDT